MRREITDRGHHQLKNQLVFFESNIEQPTKCTIKLHATGKRRRSKDNNKKKNKNKEEQEEQQQEEEQQGGGGGGGGSAGPGITIFFHYSLSWNLPHHPNLISTQSSRGIMGCFCFFLFYFAS
ncbi:hypothetical protein CISG_03124 [Coccidioides immitis RMSCC 3703]|uniref:Uncharacterized protein n=1 Tax=Coccidioides immitis RMSCC 3703 TaxID=454286 RepID=A0A0J8QJV3_COCIT|nr:hypothetical protein CISG_03124 [Coccidioides immitis RMSCC 3703]